MYTLWYGFVQLSAKSILVKIPSHVGEGEEAVKCSGPTTRYLGLKSLYARVGIKQFHIGQTDRERVNENDEFTVFFFF